MSETEIPIELKEIAKKFGVTVERDICNCGEDYGASAGKNIWLGSFSDSEIEKVAFFHEMGHTQSNKVTKRGRVMSTLSGEGLAWEIGLGIAHDNGYSWDYYGHVMKWARNQMRTYIDGEYDDTKE